MSERPDHLDGNVASWQRQAADYVAPAERAWAAAEPYWGIFGIPESGLGLLPDDMTGMRCLEVGCGGGYVSAWMSRRGGIVTGIDPTPAQLATARRLQGQHGLDIDFREGYGERLDFDTAAFDFVISEYGAALWADPYEWIPEAARVLGPGGRLVFLTIAPFTVMCAPDLESEGPVTNRLRRSYFDLYRTQWPDAPGETEFHLTHGAWIDLFVTSGLRVVRLIELQAPPDASSDYAWADADWGRRWPTEEVWVLDRNVP